jgi:hypothetical protein
MWAKTIPGAKYGERLYLETKTAKDESGAVISEHFTPEWTSLQHETNRSVLHNHSRRKNS